MLPEEQCYEDLRAGHPVAHVQAWHRAQYQRVVDQRRADAARTIRRRRAA